MTAELHCSTGSRLQIFFLYHCKDDFGFNYEPYGHLDVQVGSGEKRNLYFIAEEEADDYEVEKDYGKRFDLSYEIPEGTSDDDYVTLFGKMMERDLYGDDLIGDYDNVKIKMGDLRIGNIQKGKYFYGDHGNYVIMLLSISSE